MSDRPQPRAIPTANRPVECDDYTFGCPVGTWTASIDFKVWGRSKNLALFVTDTATGEKWWLSVFHLNDYRPCKGGPSFADDIRIGDTVELTTTHTKKTGKPHLETARKL